MIHKILKSQFSAENDKNDYFLCRTKLEVYNLQSYEIWLIQGLIRNSIFLCLFLSELTVFDSGSTPVQISETTLATGMTIFENWEVFIDLKMPPQPTGGWRNVFGLQVEG